jgi:hypothetical protein
MKIINHFKKIPGNLVVHDKSLYDWDIDKPNFIYTILCKTGGNPILDGCIKSMMTREAFTLEREGVMDSWVNMDKNKSDEHIKKDFFKFTFVRNPFDRLLSAYHELVIRQDRKPYKTTSVLYELGVYWNHMETGKKLPEGFKINPNWPISFDMFVKGYAFNEDGTPKHSDWSFQWPAVVTADGHKFVDYVGKFEDIEENWSYVAKKINLPRTDFPFLSNKKNEYYSLMEMKEIAKNSPGGKVENLGVHESYWYRDGTQYYNEEARKKEPKLGNLNLVDDYKNYYTDELIEIVSKIYQKDLEVLGYEF